ncbi:MAG: glucosamine-6-phosphate deaminase [Opitutales bacterium]|jgi:glucosamine-6-phosphate deaminase|nr:glucosamine-6-phosphate deaminase [Opitutales bacterium]MDG2167245.1 glucosamine-6-phosphate deaminase [Opitutales bacterium]
MSDSNHPTPIRELSPDALNSAVYSNRDDMGKAAALYAIDYLKSIQDTKDEIRIIVGSAPSQDEFYHHLSSLPESKEIQWSKFTVFHMDEYVGISADHPASFRAYQREHFVSKVPLKAFHEIRGESEDPEAECKRLSALLSEAPIDLACCGIGENGHLAFNDPPVADFEDPVEAKVVTLDDICRQQQVNDGCFPDFDSVPTHAITLTLKVFKEAAVLSCVVPAETKAKAVAATINGPISTDCPATLMRRHPSARMFLEPDSAALL